MIEELMLFGPAGAVAAILLMDSFGAKKEKTPRMRKALLVKGDSADDSADTEEVTFTPAEIIESDKNNLKTLPKKAAKSETKASTRKKATTNKNKLASVSKKPQTKSAKSTRANTTRKIRSKKTAAKNHSRKAA